MRSRRASDVFVIGEERILDETEFGLELEDGAQALRGAIEEEAEPLETAVELDDATREEPIRIVERRRPRAPRGPRLADGGRRWMARGVAIGSVLLVAVFIASSVLGGGEPEEPPRVAQSLPRDPTPAPERRPRDRRHDADRERTVRRSAPVAADGREPKEAELERNASVEKQPTVGTAAAAVPEPDATPAPAAPEPTPAPSPITPSTPTPSAPSSSSSATAAAASAGEVRQEFGP